MASKRFWFILQQDVDRPVGGVKQIYRFSEILGILGYKSTIVQKSSEFRPSWFSSSSTILAVSYKHFCQLQLDPLVDVIILPETFIPLFFKLPRIPIVIFNQNMHYLHGEDMMLNPAFVQSVYSSENLLHVLTVSRSDYSFAIDILPLPSSKVSLLVNAIELDIFKFKFSSNKLIAYMPRKNSDHVRIVTSMLQSQSWFKTSGWKLVPINNMSQESVAKLLRSCSIFLSFGHPEGFGLPMAEALCSGCMVVGYDGIGGRELFQIGNSCNVFNRIDYHDFYSFILAINSAILCFDRPYPSLSSDLLCASSIISQTYSRDRMIDSVRSFIAKI